MKGGGLDYTVVMVIAILNLIAYISVKDWKASGVLLFGIAASYVLPYNPMVLFLALLVAALSRSVYVEGLKNKEKDEEKPKNALEGLTQQAEKLEKKQKDLFSMAADLGPMMERAESMMNKLPPGFLEQAMKNFNK
jgi:hypothetical protein